MVRHIYDIGSGRYKFDKATLDSFIEESRNRPPLPESAGASGANPLAGMGEQEMQGIFAEVMALYHDYQKFERVDLLLRLKCRLEEFSIRYKSHVLATEVLNINSCLPYEQRISCSGKLLQEPGQEED